jgi:hypothetical protein
METQATCQHIKTNGNICQAVAMTGERLCYFHLRDRQRHRNIVRAHNLRIARFNRGQSASEIIPLDRSLDDLALGAENATENGARKSSVMFDVSAAQLFGNLEFPLLEDANAIQIAITNILRALALQQVDRRTAGVMLYSLQIACMNLQNVRPEPTASIPTTTTDPNPMPLYGEGLLPEDKQVDRKKDSAAASPRTEAPTTQAAREAS